MEEATRIKFEALEAENNRQNHRITELEEEMTQLHEIATSIKELTINMQHMWDEQKKQGVKLDKLENRDAETLKGMRQSALNTIIGVVVGALAVGLFEMMAKYL